MKAMKPSAELYTFGVTLNQDFPLYGPRPEDWIRGALVDMLPVDRRALKRQIDGWLAAGVSNADLEASLRLPVATVPRAILPPLLHRIRRGRHHTCRHRNHRRL